MTLQGADPGDTTTVKETLAEAAISVAELVERESDLHPEAEPKVNVDGIEELVAGKRYWKVKEKEQQAVYQNRQRVRGDYGKSLLRRRGELVERSFAHCYETGAMRRCTLHGTKNILKRQLIHVGAFNIRLVLRKMLGAGAREPRAEPYFATLIDLCGTMRQLLAHSDGAFPVTDGF